MTITWSSQAKAPQKCQLTLIKIYRRHADTLVFDLGNVKGLRNVKDFFSVLCPCSCCFFRKHASPTCPNFNRMLPCPQAGTYWGDMFRCQKTSRNFTLLDKYILFFIVCDCNTPWNTPWKYFLATPLPVGYPEESEKLGMSPRNMNVRTTYFRDTFPLIPFEVHLSY